MGPHPVGGAGSRGPIDRRSIHSTSPVAIDKAPPEMLAGPRRCYHGPARRSGSGTDGRRKAPDGGAEIDRGRRSPRGERAMLLPLEDVEQFFRLHKSLMFFVNQTLKVLDKEVATLEE